MDRHALVRWAGIAAIAGGTLRGVTALLPAAQTPAIHLTYLAIDLLLLLAVAGLFTFQRERTGGWGALGALLAVLGAVLLIIDDLFSPTFALYPIAAVVFALGLGVMALCAWIARTLPRWISALWLAAIAVGALSLGVAALHPLFVLSGLLLAAGFVCAGVYLYAASDCTPQDELRTGG
jgi:drug/metabolite transporter (DMT)-like permease